MLTVLSVAYPFAKMCADTAGGAEQVALQLDTALVAAGHRSLVIAQEGSRIAGELIPIPRTDGEIDDEIQTAIHKSVRREIRQALQLHSVDLIHFHGIDFAAYVPDALMPMLGTLHLPPEWYPDPIFEDTRLHLHCVSESQHARCHKAPDLLPPIPNGVDLERYRPARRKRRYVVALGRLCPEKGFHHALDAARAAGYPLILAGELFRYAAHEAHFREEIVPRAPKFIGAVGPERKRRLLSGAAAVLAPSLAPETSSLVAMEAAACGTPVIAFPSGALQEVVRNDNTGFVVPDTKAMAEALRRIDAIDPQQCRSWAEKHFDLRRTAAHYLSLYARLAREWEEVFDLCPDAPPFLHPAWQRPWWSMFGNGALRIFRVRRKGALAALAVCFEYNGRLVFAGNGISDRLDILASDGDCAAELIDQFGRYPLDLQEIPQGSPLLARFLHEKCSVCPVLDLARPKPSKLSRHLRQSRRALGAHALGTHSEPRLLDELFRLHRARWSSRNEPGLLTDSNLLCFHRAASAGLARAGMLRLHTLTVEGRYAGILYGFTRNGVMHYYLSGFEPALARYSPGSLLVEHAIDYARSCGDTTFDFLRGAEPYKYRWGAVDKPQYRIWT